MSSNRVWRRLGGWVITLVALPKRLLVRRLVHSSTMGETLIQKKLALPVLGSDALSSNAYATEEILLMLSLGGLSLLHVTPWVAGAVVLLLVVVVLSYRQTCHAYPGGGGAYAVSRANLGRNVALVAGSALLVDYVLTVAVSVAAGVANIVSAIPSLAPHTVSLAIGLVTLLALMNLRGTNESGRFFAVPTYGFVLCVFAMLALGALQILSGKPPVAESATIGIRAQESASGLLVAVLVLRAFAFGCTALTGLEAVGNGVPRFKKPKSRNAASTLSTMAILTVVMFVGIAALALVSKVHVAADPSQLVGAPRGYNQRTVIAQIAGAVFGNSSIGFYAVQAFTVAILVLAANTAFSGFPILASILGHDGFLPRQLARRGDRPVFSNGIVILAVLAIALIWAYDASTTRLIQLYIIGVFVAFTLSQAGMVRHWLTLMRPALKPKERGQIQRSLAINALGAATTALVLVIVLVTTFIHGAWIVVIAMPVVFALMAAIRGHYDAVAIEVAPAPAGVLLPSRIHAIVLVSKLHAPTLRALAFARASHPHTLTALTVRTSPEETDELMREWVERDVPVPLTVLDSLRRDVTGPVIEHIAHIHRESSRDVVSVFVPEYVVGHWWERALHNQSALRLKGRLLFQPGVMVTSVPFRLTSAEIVEARRAATLKEASAPEDANIVGR